MTFGIRITILGTAFLVLFSLLGLRLWSVQVAQGARISEEADALAWVELPIPAPRGDIYARNGTQLVTSQMVPQVVVDRTFISDEERETVVQRLAGALGMNPGDLDAMYEEAGINGRFVVESEEISVDPNLAYALNEQLADVPGVSIENLPQRVYLDVSQMAHVLGYLGLPDQSDLDERPGLNPTAKIGKLGVERAYDEYLQGEPGQRSYRVQAGSIIEQRDPVPPVQGDSLTLTLESELQQTLEGALASGVELSNEYKTAVTRNTGEEFQTETSRAAGVVVDITTGEVMAMASYPSFDPNSFVDGIDAATFERLNQQKAFNNLASAGLFPPASTFKLITAAAFIEEDLPLPTDGTEGVDFENEMVHCDGVLQLDDLADGSPQEFTDWYYPGNKGWLNIDGAIEHSCNIFFWSTALGIHRAFRDSEEYTVLQDWARSVGYGEATGIDLPGDPEGIVPTPQLFQEWREYQLENPDEPPRLDASRLESENPWVGGDLMNMAIGQGYLTATPLQVALSYGALTTGELVKPYVVSEVTDADGEVVYQGETEVRSEVDISRSTSRRLLTDLNRVVTTGTAQSAFVDFGPGLDQIAGKTGTGQSIATADNHAWFVGITPVSNPKYVVAVVIEEGGSGGAVAAPVGRHILQALVGNEPTPIVQGAAED